jgi:hypothetical protein
VGLPKKVRTGYIDEYVILPQGLLILPPIADPIYYLFQGVTNMIAFYVYISQFLFNLFARTIPSIFLEKLW